MAKCCGKKVTVKTYEIPERKSADGAPGWKAQRAVWLECQSCHKSTAYSYASEQDAEAAWESGLIGRRV